MLAIPETAPLPSHGSVEELLQRLRIEPAAAADVADALLGLSAREPHPRLKSALLHHAGMLVRSTDPERSAILMREAFRLFPTAAVGAQLAEASAEDPSAQRLFRHGHLVDAVAALSAGPRERQLALTNAVRHHLALGHGAAALKRIAELVELAKLTHDGAISDADLQDWAEIAESQAASRQESLASQRLELAECSGAERPAALVAYAELLLAGDEPLGDAAAVLADALDCGAAAETVAPLWVEVARAMGDEAELTRALACALTAGAALPTQVQHADELANIPSVDRAAPEAAQLALQALIEVIPDDAVLASRMRAVQAMLATEPEPALEALRQATIRDRDRHGEANASLALAWLAAKRGDWTTAERHYRRVRTLAPQDTEALDFFERFYREHQDHKRLLVALSQRLSGTEGRDAVRIGMEMAALCEGPLATPERAVESFQRVLTVQPDHEQALAGLLRLYESLGRHAAVRETLDRQAYAWIAKSTINPQARLHAKEALLRLAALAGDSSKGGDKGMALSVYRRVLGVDASEPTAVRALADHYKEHSNSVEYADVLRGAAAVEGRAESKAALLAELGSLLAGPMGDPAAAAVAWSEALRLDPERRDLVPALRKVAAASGDKAGVYHSLATELRAVLGEAAATGGDRPEAAVTGEAAADLVESLLQAAELAPEFDESPLQSAHWLAAASRFGPGQPAVLAAISALLQHDPAAQVALLEQQLGTSPQASVLAVRVALLAPLAAVGQWEKASAQAQLVLQADPEAESARSVALSAAVALGDAELLRDLCGAGEDGAQQFAATALAGAESAVGALRYYWWQQAAQVAERELGSHEQACEILAQALQEALAEADGVVADAARLDLALAARRAAKGAGLLGVERMALEALAAWAPPAEQGALRLDLAELSWATGDQAEGLALARSVAEDAVNEGMPANLARAARIVVAFAGQLADPQESDALATAVADLLELASSDTTQGGVIAAELPGLWLDIARCAAAREEDWALVIRALDQRAVADVESSELRERALSELGEWSAALDVAEARAELLTGAARLECLRRAAVLCDTAGNDPARAERLYRTVVAHNPEDREAWAGLLAAVRACGDETAVAGVLDTMVGKAPLARDSMAIALVELAALRAGADSADPLATAWPTLIALANSSELSESEETLLQIAQAQLEIPERSVQVAERLLPVWQQHQRASEALQCQEVLARGAPVGSDARRTGLLAVAAALADSEPAKAFDLLTLAAAEALDQPAVLDQWLATAARAGKQADALLQLHQWTLEPAAPGAASTGLLERLANLAHELEDHSTAELALGAWQAIDLGNSNPWQQQLVWATERDDAASMASALRKLTSLGSDTDRAESWLRLASCVEPGAVAAVLADAARDLPHRSELWTAWLAALRDLSDPSALADGLSRAIAASAIGAEDLPGAERELAEALSQSGQEHQVAAAKAWLAVLERDPADDAGFTAAQAAVMAATSGTTPLETVLPLLEHLEMVADARGDTTACLALLQFHLSQAQEAGPKLIVLRQLLRLTEDSLGDYGAALAYGLDIIQLAGSDADMLAHTHRLTRTASGEATGATAAAALWEAAAVHQADAAVRLSWRRAAAVAVQHHASPAALRALLQGILADAPGDTATLEHLGRLAEQDGDVQARLALLALRIEAAAGGASTGAAGPQPELAQLYLEQAQLAETAEDWLQAVTSYENASQIGDADLSMTADLQLVEAAERAAVPLRAAPALQRLRDAETDDDARALLTLRLANAWRDGGSRAAALEALIQGYSAQTTSEFLFVALETELRDRDPQSEKATQEQLLQHLAGAWQRVQWQDPADAQEVAARWLQAVRSYRSEPQQWQDAAERLAGASTALPAVSALLDDIAGSDADRALLCRAMELAGKVRREIGDLEGVVAAHLQLLANLETSQERLRERRVVAALFADELLDPAAAFGQWQAALEEDEWQYEDAIQLLQSAEACESGESAEDLLALTLEVGEVDERRVGLWSVLAERAAGRQDFAKALEYLGHALRQRPEFEAAVQQYLTILGQWPEAPAGSWDGLLQHRRQHAPDASHRASAALKLAVRQVEQIGCDQQALALLQEALLGAAELAPEVFEVLQASEIDSPLTAQAAQLAAPTHLAAALWLEAQARQAEDWTELARLLHLRAEQNPQGDSETAAAAWLEAADVLAGPVGDAKAAAATLDTGLQALPGNAVLLEQRISLALQGGDLTTAAATWGALAAATEGEQAAQAWIQQGQLLHKLGQSAAAAEACDLALLAAPATPAALQLRADVLYAQLPGEDPAALLEQVLETAQQLDQQDDWFDRVVDLVSSGTVEGDAATAVVALAAAVASGLEQPERAADLWELLWDQRPDDADARNSVLALRRDAKDPLRLAAALDRALMFADVEEALDWKLELAQLKLAQLGRPREALRLVLDVLEQQAEHPGAAALAEQLTQNPVCGDEALAALETLYRSAQQWDGLAGVLRKRIERTHSPATRAELAQALAEVQMRSTSHAGEAFDSLWMAVQANPQISTLLAMEGASSTSSHQMTLAAAYPLVLAGPVRGPERAAILLKHAELCQRLGQLDTAIDQLRDAIVADPHAAQAYDALDQLLDQQGRFAEQLATLVDRAENETDPDARRSCLHRVAGLGRALSNHAVAEQAYSALAEIDPQDRETISSWVDLLRELDGSGREAVNRLTDGLVRLAALTDDPSEKAEQFCEAARVQSRSGDREGRAEDLYRAAFDADPRGDEAFVWLEKSLHSQPRQLMGILQMRADALSGGPAKVVILRKLASACRELGDGEGACAALQQALAQDPGNGAVLDDWLKTAEANRVWPSWYAAAELRLAKEPRREGRLPFVIQMARVAISELDDTAKAQTHAAELSAAAGNDPGARLVLALLRARSGDPTEAATGLEQVLKETDDPRMLLSLHQQLADLYLGAADNPGKGMRELQRIIALDPKRWEVRRRLCDLYRARQSLEALAECLRQWLAALQDTQERVTLELGRGTEMVGLMLELAEVLAALGQPQEGAQILKKAWNLNGHSVAVNETLAPLLETTGEADLAAELHDWLAQYHVADKARLAGHLSRAALIHERRGDLIGARERFKRALESAPGDDAASLGSARVCLALNEIDRAMRLFDVVAHRPPQECSAELRADAHYGIGQCRLARLQREQARAAFEQALSVSPGHKGARDALARL